MFWYFPFVVFLLISSFPSLFFSAALLVLSMAERVILWPRHFVPRALCVRCHGERCCFCVLFVCLDCMSIAFLWCPASVACHQATQPSSTPPLDSSSLNVHTQSIQVVDRPAGSDPFSDGVAAGWLQRREGDFFCILCSKWCTPEHLRKEAHLRKVEWHAREHTMPQAPEPPQEPQPVTSQQQGTDPPPPPMPPQGTQLWQRQRQGETVTPPPPPPPPPPVMPPPSLSLPVSVPAVYMLGVEAGWLEMREGEPYCKACSKWASGNHLETTRHQNAVQYMEVQLSQRPQQNAEGWKIFIDGEEFCDLCNKWATADHMNTRKHQELVELWRAREVVPQQPVEPFLQLRDCSGGWNVMERFCLLCNKWADQGHLESSVHLRQVQENLVGGVGVAMEPVEQCTATLVGNDEPNKVVARRVVRRRAKVTDAGGYVSLLSGGFSSVVGRSGEFLNFSSHVLMSLTCSDLLLISFVLFSSLG